jgi:protein TonB
VIDRRLLVCVAGSVIGHLALAGSLERLPERTRLSLPPTVEVRVIRPPPPQPPPEPEPPARPPPEPPSPRIVHERPRTRPIRAPREVVPADTPPSDVVPVTAETTTTPVFGVTMRSTSTAGGPSLPVGNTTQPAPAGAGEVRPLAVAAAYEVTKMPIPQGRCSGTYTEAARAAALEGTVILDLVVDEAGRSRDIEVVAGLAHGLTAAAIEALRRCRFTPGEREGRPVAVRVRSFKIRFVMQDG